MRLIGLCGRSGSGKSLFSTLAQARGLTVIDCDAIYKNLVSYRSQCLIDIESAFGREVIENNSLNRRALAPIVFSNKAKLELLNSITHKHILAEIENILLNADEKSIVILDAPTLFESGLNEKCQEIIAIVAPDELCVSRIISRDGIDRDSAVSRLSNQKPTEFYIENCDIIIYNDTTEEDYKNASLQVIKSLKEGSL